MMGTRVWENVRRSAPQVSARTRIDDQVHAQASVTATSKWLSVACNIVATAVLGAMFASAARATTIGPDASGFTANNSTAFAFEEISGTGTRVLPNTDDGFVSVPIGFTFNFYGTGYSSLFASSNGLITFGSGNISFANDNLTTAAAPRRRPQRLAADRTALGRLVHRWLGRRRRLLPDAGECPVSAPRHRMAHHRRVLRRYPSRRGLRHV